MILWRAGRIALMLVLPLIAVQARADVLEIGDGGAHWVAGPLAAAQAAAAPGSEGSAFPAGALADPALTVRGVPPQYAAKVAELATRYDLSPALIEALVWQESRWRHNAISPKGAQGLAQLMPGTARYLGVDPRDPQANLEGGARYLREQLNRFGGDLEKALAAYNAGPGRVEQAGGIPQIRETRQYVASILGRLSHQTRKEDQ